MITHEHIPRKMKAKGNENRIIDILRKCARSLPPLISLTRKQRYAVLCTFIIIPSRGANVRLHLSCTRYRSTAEPQIRGLSSVNEIMENIETNARFRAPPNSDVAAIEAEYGAPDGSKVRIRYEGLIIHQTPKGVYITMIIILLLFLLLSI